MFADKLKGVNLVQQRMIGTVSGGVQKYHDGLAHKEARKQMLDKEIVGMSASLMQGMISSVRWASTFARKWDGLHKNEQPDKWATIMAHI